MLRTRSFPNLWQALLFLGFYWVMMQAPLELAVRAGVPAHPYLAIGAVLIGSPLCALAVLGIGCKLADSRPGAVFPLGGTPPLAALATLAATAGAWIFLDSLHAASSGHAVDPTRGRYALLFFVTPVVYAPLFEELLHRGLLLRGLLTHYSTPVAVALSAALFASTHAPAGVQSAMSAFCFGLLTAWLFTETRSLLPGILVHASSNLLFTISPRVNRPFWAWLGVARPAWLDGGMYPALGLALAILGVVLFVRARRPENSPAALVMSGLSLARSAHAESGEARDRLFAEALDRFARAAAAEPSPQALIHWGGTLLLQAESRDEAEQEQLRLLACDKFAEALRLDARARSAITLWALTLGDISAAKPIAEADRLIDQAREKFAAATAIDPDVEHTFLVWGQLLLDHAARKAGEEARLLYSEARRRYEQAIAIAPRNPQSRLNCAAALWRIAGFESAVRAAGLLQEAESHCATALDIDPESAPAWDTWGTIFMVQASKAAPPQARALRDEARSRYLRAEEFSPGIAAYHLACLCALQNEEASCHEWLRKLEYGDARTREKLIADPDFQSVRHRQWFRELVAPRGA